MSTRNFNTIMAITFVTTAVLVAPNASQAITIIYDFESASSVLTDGRDVGSQNPGGGSGFDTADDWTWYTESSTTNDNLTIPFGGGSETIGEQQIRVGAGLELQTNGFSFSWGPGGTATALRSLTYADVGTGAANMDWAGNNANLKAYFSQDGGASWTALTDGVDFAAVAGTLELALIGNDGNDSNTLVDTITVSFEQQSAVPEPSTLALTALALLSLGFIGRRRRRR